MGQKLVKQLGAKEKCPTCRDEIICNEVPASGDYPAKLQWQNKDGKAHYNFDFKTKAVSCKSEHQQQLDQVSGLSNGNKLDEIIVILQRIDLSLKAALDQEVKH